MNRLLLIEDWIDLAISDLKAVSKLSIIENRGLLYSIRSSVQKNS